MGRSSPARPGNQTRPLPTNEQEFHPQSRRREGPAGHGRPTDDDARIPRDKAGEAFWSEKYFTAETERGFRISRDHVKNSISITRAHVVPRWGSVALPDMTFESIDRWIVGLQKTRGGHLSSQSVNHVLFRLRSILDFAMREGRISDNPAKKVRPVKLIKTARGSLTMGEASALLMESNWPSVDPQH